MIWVGLSGGMGCGKSTALKVFKKLGCATASADEIVSQLYNDKTHVHEITQLLGLTTNKNETLYELKKKISETVFDNRSKLKILENYLHPLVRQRSLEIKNEHEKQKHTVSIYEVPLLFEKNMESLFHKTICIGARSDVQLKRLKSRNPDWSEKEIQSRLKSQLALEEKKKRADYYIDNSKTEKDLEARCAQVLKDLEAEE